MIKKTVDTKPAALTREDLALRAAARAGIPEETASAVVGAFLESCKEALLHGERVDLGGLLDLGVIVEPARIRQDPSGRFSEIAPARSRLDVQVGAELEDRLATQRTAGILLVMPREGAFTEILTDHFEKLGWSVSCAATLDQAKPHLEVGRPYMLVVDHSLPDRDELVAQVKGNWRTNSVPVVTVHTRFEDLEHPERLLVRGDLTVFEPLNVHAFLRSMDQLLAQASEESAIFERQIHFRMPAREEEILRGFDLSDSFFKDSGFRGDPLVGLTTAFREAVRNAEIHGCLEDPGRSIDVEMLLDKEKITVIVEDEGDGFAHAEYLEHNDGTAPVAAARKRHREGGMGGLGLYLMERCADRLEYNEAGNRVTITKYRDTPEGKE